jgi:peptidoglycan hydrolase-like protein with peptidoglycan-binding domain
MAQIASMKGVAAPTFSRDLRVGSNGSDVRDLQVWLNAHGYVIASGGPGSSGNETTKFGNATKTALAKFQKAVGISPAAGFFGAKTRAYVAAHP